MSPPVLSDEILDEIAAVLIEEAAKGASEGTGPPYYRLGRAARYSLEAATRWLETKRAGGSEMVPTRLRRVAR